MTWVRISPNRLRWVDEDKKETKVKTHYVIPDIEPYKAMCGDVAGQMIKSRKEHREFIRRNGYIEVGNEHRQFFEYGGKSRDNQWAERNPEYSRAEFERNARRRTR